MEKSLTNCLISEFLNQVFESECTVDMSQNNLPEIIDTTDYKNLHENKSVHLDEKLFDKRSNKRRRLCKIMPEDRGVKRMVKNINMENEPPIDAAVCIGKRKIGPKCYHLKKNQAKIAKIENSVTTEPTDITILPVITTTEGQLVHFNVSDVSTFEIPVSNPMDEVYPMDTSTHTTISQINRINSNIGSVKLGEISEVADINVIKSIEVSSNTQDSVLNFVEVAANTEISSLNMAESSANTEISCMNMVESSANTEISSINMVEASTNTEFNRAESDGSIRSKAGHNHKEASINTDPVEFSQRITTKNATIQTVTIEKKQAKVQSEVVKTKDTGENPILPDVRKVSTNTDSNIIIR